MRRIFDISPPISKALAMTGPEQVQLRGRNVARWAWPLVLVSLLVAGLFAADAWLPLFPREPGRRLTELFLRSLLIAYMSVVVLIPLVLAVSVWLLIRARQRGQRRPMGARLALLCGSAGLAVLGLELAASAWLAWVHRLPHLPTDFPRSATVGDEVSLVVIGGSSAMGYPYDPTISIGQIVAWKLEQARPGRRVDLDIRANLGRNLEDMHKELATLRRRPDALIVFSGHNEFLSRFETMRDAGYAEAPAGAFLHGLYQLSLHSPFCLWVYETVRKHRLGGPPPALKHHLLIDVPAFTPSELLQILTDFRRRLEAIVGYCEQIGAVPILVVPACNESGFEPNEPSSPLVSRRPSVLSSPSNSNRPGRSRRMIRRRARHVIDHCWTGNPTLPRPTSGWGDCSSGPEHLTRRGNITSGPATSTVSRCAAGAISRRSTGTSRLATTASSLMAPKSSAPGAGMESSTMSCATTPTIPPWRAI